MVLPNLINQVSFGSAQAHNTIEKHNDTHLLGGNFELLSAAEKLAHQ